MNLKAKIAIALGIVGLSVAPVCVGGMETTPAIIPMQETVASSLPPTPTPVTPQVTQMSLEGLVAPKVMDFMSEKSIFNVGYHISPPTSPGTVMTDYGMPPKKIYTNIYKVTADGKTATLPLAGSLLFAEKGRPIEIGIGDLLIIDREHLAMLRHVANIEEKDPAFGRYKIGGVDSTKPIFNMLFYSPNTPLKSWGVSSEGNFGAVFNESTGLRWAESQWVPYEWHLFYTLTPKGQVTGQLPDRFEFTFKHVSSHSSPSPQPCR